MPGRIRLISLFLVVGLLLMTGRLFFVQVIKGSDYSKKSAQQSRRRSIVHAKRGMIKDRNGVILAESIAKKVELKAIGLSTDKKNGDNNKVKRLYPFDGLAASVIGYVGTDGEGLSGIEYAFEDYLKGEDGWDIVLKDGRNRKHSRIDMPGKDPINGANVYLTIDLNIQKIVEKVLSQAVRKLGAKNGMCIVMDPTTGEVLAMANMPGFNPNIWKEFPHAYRKNRCVGYNYEPGSTFKVITAASAIQEKLKSENDTIDANGGRYEVYDQVIRDHDTYGKITFKDALSYSSNVCFAKVANELGNDRFYKYIKDFGFGAETGLKLPGEEAGIVHPIKKWSGRTRVTMAMGQEISATLLQMMAAFGTVANGGILLQPKIINSVVSSNGEVLLSEGQIARRRVLSNKTASRLREMMKGVVEYGTAKRIAIDGMQIAGKTGTSQKIDPETGAYSNDLVWASFIGFVPADKPELVCGVVIDEPANGEAGGTAAGPVFAQIFKQIVSHPHLDYAEKLLNDAAVPKFVDVDGSGRRYPDLCGMNVKDASKFLKSENINFEIVGRGQVISHQTPPAGKVFSSKSGLILYTQHDYVDSEYETNDIRVPYCVGKDLRDAVNAINLKGLSPYVKGAGIVRKQVPVSGSLVSNMEVCTLFCSFEG